MRSSPGPKTGCSLARHSQSAPPAEEVAILTRSEDRVQHSWDPVIGSNSQVAILTRSEDRVQRDEFDLVRGVG